MAVFELFDEDQNLLCSPCQAVVIVATYVALVTKVGPYFMKNRPAFQLKEILLVYNFVQIVLNALLCLQLLKMRPKGGYLCFRPLHKEDDDLVDTLAMHYYYYILKIFDFMDTVFMVLRKKNNQISFLHTYHHITTFAMAWYGGAYYPGGLAFYVGVGNTFVHSVMYLYYLVSSLQYKSVLWWKKYITILQLVQHWILLFFALVSLLNPHCDYSKILSGLGLCNMVVLIYFFTKFYIDNYLSHKHD
ncbi:very long chain fatty acid elongase 4-like [Zophobas morio]|uniref:very long chain fatty acid elongase 4-like n=1 Tax=Zophobas morio TaxID=2755281 RepID=UPI003083ABCD